MTLPQIQARHRAAKDETMTTYTITTYRNDKPCCDIGMGRTAKTREQAQWQLDDAVDEGMAYCEHGGERSCDVRVIEHTGTP